MTRKVLLTYIGYHDALTGIYNRGKVIPLHLSLGYALVEEADMIIS